MTTQPSLLFRVQGNAYQQMIAWRQRIDLEVLRYQIETRGQALVTYLHDRKSVQKISTLPKPGEVRAYYGMFGGAYRFSFHPLSGPQTGQLPAEQAAPLTGPLPCGCELEVYNQMGGFAFFYPNRIDPLRLFLPNPPELVMAANGHTRPLNSLVSDLMKDTPPAGELRFHIPAQLYATLKEWGWYGRSLSAYDFIFTPTSSGCLVSVRMRERGIILDLVKEETL